MKHNTHRFAGYCLAVLAFAGLTHASSVQAGWTYLPLQPVLASEYYWARTCKIAQTGGFGPVWKIKFQVYRKYLRPSQSIGMNLYRQNNAGVLVAWNNQWLYGYYGGFETYASRLPELNDRVQFFGSDQFPNNSLVIGNGLYSPANFQTCD